MKRYLHHVACAIEDVGTNLVKVTHLLEGNGFLGPFVSEWIQNARESLESFTNGVHPTLSRSF